MFQIGCKQSNETLYTMDNYVNCDPIMFHCYIHPKAPKAIWISLLIYSAVVFVIFAWIFSEILLSEMGYTIPLNLIIVCTGLLWAVLVLAVYYNIKHLNFVDLLTIHNEGLNIELNDKTVHVYDIDDISILKLKRVRSRNMRTEHFKLLIKDSQKKLCMIYWQIIKKTFFHLYLLLKILCVKNSSKFNSYLIKRRCNGIICCEGVK